MPRKFFVGGNWKACPQTKDLAEALIKKLNKVKQKYACEVVIAAPSIYLPLLKSELRKDWSASAQNVFDKDCGAFTGEITPPMLDAFGIKWTILGHSERRDILHEDDRFLTSKARFALENGLNIIYCCGEHIEEREGGGHVGFVSRQIEELIPAIPQGKWDNVVIAYEPIWAIGTGKTASKEDAQEMCKKIREIIRERVSEEVAKSVRILYGGSVKAANALELAQQEDVDGFLVGSASLTDDFIEIVNSASAKGAGSTSKTCLLM